MKVYVKFLLGKTSRSFLQNQFISNSMSVFDKTESSNIQLKYFIRDSNHVHLMQSILADMISHAIFFSIASLHQCQDVQNVNQMCNREM